MENLEPSGAQGMGCSPLLSPVAMPGGRSQLPAAPLPPAHTVHRGLGPPTRLPSSHPTIPWEPRARLPNRHPFPPPAIRPGGSGLGVGRQGPQGLETDSRRVRLPVQRPVQGDTCWADCVFPFNRLARPPLQNHCHAGSLLYGTAHVPLTCERLSPQPRPCRAVLFLG